MGTFWMGNWWRVLFSMLLPIFLFNMQLHAYLKIVQSPETRYQRGALSRNRKIAVVSCHLLEINTQISSNLHVQKLYAMSVALRVRLGYQPVMVLWQECKHVLPAITVSFATERCWNFIDCFQHFPRFTDYRNNTLQPWHRRVYRHTKSSYRGLLVTPCSSIKTDTGDVFKSTQWSFLQRCHVQIWRPQCRHISIWTKPATTKK